MRSVNMRTCSAVSMATNTLTPHTREILQFLSVRESYSLSIYLLDLYQPLVERGFTVNKIFFWELVLAVAIYCICMKE